MSKEEKKTVQGKYVPTQPVDPNEYSVQQYLFDTNTLLTRIESDLLLLIQMISSDKQQKDNRNVRTIGITK